MATWSRPTGTAGATLWFSVDVVAQSAAGNWSDIRYVLSVSGVPSATFYGSPIAVYASISVDSVSTNSPSWSSGTTSRTFIDKTVRVSHNANGTLSFAINAGIQTATGTQGLGGPTNVFDSAPTFTVPTLTTLPGTPTGVSASRVSDTQLSVSWSHSSPSNGAPTSVRVEQRVNGGSWVLAANLSPTTSATLTSAANRKTEFRVRQSNSAGTTAWSAVSAPVFTSPAAPTSVVADKDSAQDITVSWVSNVAFAECEHVVEHSTDDGVSWSALTVVTGTSYTHVAPNPADTHRYRVRARNTDTAALTSAWVTSNNVQLLAAPDKPGVGSVPANADKGADFTFGWVHNPVDTTPQTAFEVEFSLDGGATWSTTGKVTSAVSGWVIPADTYAATDDVTLRVRTWGQASTGGSDSTGASPWSDPRTVTFWSAPVASIVDPDGAWDQSELTVTFGFAQAESAQFVQATLTLSDSVGLLETKTTNTLSPVVFDTRVLDGETYTVTVLVTDSRGLVSAVTSETFAVAYTLPVMAGVTLTYLREQGMTQIDIVIPEPGVGEAEAVSLTIARTIDGVTGVLTSNYPAAPELTFLDTTPTIRGDNHYRVVTRSADGAERLFETLPPELTPDPLLEGLFIITDPSVTPDPSHEGLYLIGTE